MPIAESSSVRGNLTAADEDELERIPAIDDRIFQVDPYRQGNNPT